MNLFGYLREISQDSNPDEAGFQARFAYVALCVVVPLIFGCVIGIVGRIIERVFARGEAENG